MIVVDASVVVDALIAPAGSTSRARLASEDLAAPDFLDVEVASALRGLWLGRRIDDHRIGVATDDLARIPVLRHPSRTLVPRCLSLRANMSPYDACYVALAEALDCPLVTLDRRLASAPGSLCEVEVLDL